MSTNHFIKLSTMMPITRTIFDSVRSKSTVVWCVLLIAFFFMSGPSLGVSLPSASDAVSKLKEITSQKAEQVTNREWRRKIADLRLSIAVRSAIALNPMFNSTDLTVSLHAGEVEVQGHLDSERQKALLLDLLRNVDGVKEVDLSAVDLPTKVEERRIQQPLVVARRREVSEEPTSGRTVEEMLTDARIEVSFWETIAKERNLAARRLTMESFKQVVILDGEVPSQDVRERLATIAESIPGVEAVQDFMTVGLEMGSEDGAAQMFPESKQQETRKENDPFAFLASKRAQWEQAIGDGLLLARIKLAFALNKTLSGSGLKVEVKERVARLSGLVPDESVRTLAVETARGVPGVEDVIDEIRAPAAAQTTPFDVVTGEKETS